MKAQPWQLDINQYDPPFTATPLYAQLDTERHVNNVGVLSFYSEARQRLQMEALGPQSWFSDEVLLRPRRTVTQFIGEVHYLQDVSCTARLVALEADRYRLALALFQEGRCVGVQECLMGAWQDDRWIDLPATVAEPLRARLDSAPSLMPWPDDHDNTLTGWPCHSRLLARYADLDPDRALAELTIARCMEQSRAQPVGRIRPPGYGLMVARLDIVFQRWDCRADELTLPSGVSRIGNTSFVVRGLVEAENTLVASGESVLVMFDRGAGRTVPITGDLLGRMKGLAVDGVTIQGRPA